MIVLMTNGQILTFAGDVNASQESPNWVTIRERTIYGQDGTKIADIKVDQIKVIYFYDKAYIDTLEKKLVENFKVE
jgi:hypothetical protein